jgi:hypothetical protein
MSGLLLAAFLWQAGAVLEIQYSAIRKIIVQQAFTEDGRRYVRGNKGTRCDYAFLERPEITEQGGRMLIRARFTGKSAANLFGQCVGLGDSFDVAILATPYYHEGRIGLKDVTVESPGRDGFYIRRVLSAMAASLSRDFAYHVMADARRILEEPRKDAPYQQQMKQFQVTQIRVTPAALVVTLGFTLSVQ